MRVSETHLARANVLPAAIFSLVCVVLSGPDARADAISQSYQLTDLGVYPGPIEGAGWTGSSSSGVIIGNLPIQNGDRTPPTQPVAWIGGQLVSMAPNVTGYSSAVNASGQVVGSIADYNSSTQVSSNPRYFEYSNGTLTDLGNFGGSSTGRIAISDNGLIAASVVAANGSSSVIVDSGGNIVQVPAAVPGASMTPTAINNAGQVIGTFTSASGNGQGFLYSGGKTIELGGLQGSSPQFTNWPLALSSNGIVAGIAYEPNSLSGQSPSYVYVNGVMSRIPEYQGNEFIPSSVNAQGVVLGSAPIGVTSSGDIQQFQQLLYNSTNGVLTPLSALLPSNWTVNAGISINDQGQILARATENGVDHLVELTPLSLGGEAPVPEPGTLAIFGLIACAFAVRKGVLSRRD
jgi:probable HAF family extracellular repeat protein